MIHGSCRRLLPALALFTLTAGRVEAADRALVLSTDFSTGYYSRLDLAAPFTHTNNAGSTASDAVARMRDGRFYILGRFGFDFVQVVDPVTFGTTIQYSVGNGTNPQDIVLCSPTKAYVSLYERNYLAIINPQTGAALGSVDLSSFADADGLPEAAGLARVGNRVFVALQRLDRPGGFVASNPSLVAVVDCTTDQLVDADPVTPGIQAITLTGRNPFADMSVDPVREKIVVGEVGNFGVLDGGVEYINPVTLQAEGFFITESALGGDLNAVKLAADCTGYVIVNDATFRTKLVRFDRCAHTVLDTPLQSSGFDLCDVEIDYARGHVLVSDRDFTHPGVRILDAKTGVQITTSPLDLGLPPCDIALADATPSGAPPAPVAGGLRLSHWPDPFNPTAAVRVDGAGDAPVRIDIVDVRGREVRLLWQGTLPGGTQTLAWDGRDDRGRALASGVYWARARTTAAAATDRLTLVR
jgi:hypothetical protein